MINQVDKGYKFRIYPNKTQQKQIEMIFGCCRFVYNYFLAKSEEDHKQGNKFSSTYDNQKVLTSMKKEQDLLEYDIFNQNKNYFKVNKKKDNKPYISVKSKELINFLLKEYSDNVSDKVPRSKKLYDESNLSTENKANSHFIFNNNQENKEKRNEETIIAIKEDGSERTLVVYENYL